MATVTPTLTITSTDALVDTLALSVTDSLTITGQCQYGAAVTGTGTKVDFFLDSAFGPSMVYFKNLSTSSSDRSGGSTESIKIYVDEELTLLIGPGEFAFFPFYAGGAGKLQLQTSANTVQVEYAYFTRG